MPRRKATRELVTSCCPGSRPRRSKGAQRSANALVSAMFGVAHDVYRFTCFLFLPLLFAGLALLQRRGGATMLAVLGAVSVRLMVLQRDSFERIAVKVLTDVDGNGIPFVRPDIVGDIVPKVIPALPWTFAAYAAAAVACVVIGLLRARRTRTMAARDAVHAN